MKTIRVVIWKEGHAFLRDRLRVVALTFFALIFGIYFAGRYGRMFFVPTALLPTLAAVYTALVVVPIWGFVFIEVFGVIFSLVRGSVGAWLLTGPMYVAVLLSTLSPKGSSVVNIVLSSLWLPPVAGLCIAALLYALMRKLSKDRMTRVAS